jgi:tyrosine-protein kinase Etk/Wzc
MLIDQSHTSEPLFLDLPTIVKILFSKKKTIIFISLIVFIISMLYISFKPIYYQSKMLLKIQNTQLNTSINTNTSALDPSNMHEPVSVQLALLKSDFILQSVIEALKLNITVIPQKKLFEKNNDQIIIQHLHVPSKLLNKKLELVIKDNTHYQLYNSKGKFLIEGITGKNATDPSNTIHLTIENIKALPGSRFTLIKKSDHEILNQIRTHLSITDLSNSGDNSENPVAILQLSLIGKNSQSILDMLNNTVFITQEKNIDLKYLQADKTLTFLQQELPILKQSLEAAEEKLNQYRATSGRINVELQTNYLINHLSNLDKELENIRVKKTNLLQQYTQHHPMVISLNEEENEIEMQRNHLLKELKELPASNQEDVNLMRDVKIKNDLYVQLLNEIHQLQVNKAGIVSDIQILSPATLPETVPQANKALVAIVSLLTGLFIGSSGVLFWSIVTNHRFIFDQLLGRKNFKI